MFAAEITASHLMPVFEYKVIPAPRRGEKAKGAKTAAERFSHAMSEIMNDLGREGWEYLRADTLPCEERVGLTGKTTAFQHILVFRRTKADPEGSLQQPATAMIAPPILTIAPEGTAPRIANVTVPTSAAPLGPARDGDVAAE